MADKIVGPLTLVQFVYLMAGGIIIYLAQETASAPIFWLIAIPTGAISLSLAFLKVQDQPFSHFLGALALYFTKPRKRVWGKIPEMETVHAVTESTAVKEEKKVYKGKTISQTNLEELAYVLDTRGLTKEKKQDKTNTQLT